ALEAARHAVLEVGAARLDLPHEVVRGGGQERRDLVDADEGERGRLGAVDAVQDADQLHLAAAPGEESDADVVAQDLVELEAALVELEEVAAPAVVEQVAADQVDVVGGPDLEEERLVARGRVGREAGHLRA